MSAVAVQVPLEVPRLRPVPDADVERWEVHSELALVSPEVRARALELAPERDPDAFLTALRRPLVVAAPDDVEAGPGLAVAASAYALGRVIQTARSALLFVAGLVALASLIEVLH